MKRYALLDCVDLGVTESENVHEPLGNIRWGNADERNQYRGPARHMGRRDQAHYREAPDTNSIRLDVPPDFYGCDIEVEIALMTSVVGDVEQPPERTFLHAMSRTHWVRMAEIVVPADGRFHVYRFGIPGFAVEETGLMVRIDDSLNYFDDHNHYGKAIGFIRFAAPKEAPRVDRRQTVPLDAGGRAPDILLAMCPIWDTMMPPIAMGALASYLEGNGVRVAVYDFNIEAFYAVDPDEQFLWEGSHAVQWSDYEYGLAVVERHRDLVEQAVDRILSYRAPVVGFSVATVNAPFTLRVAQKIKERSPQTKIVFGGPGLPFFAEGQLGEHWDYLVYGAGEKPLLSIVRGDADGTVGVVTRNRPEAYDPGRNRAFLTDLDEMPLIHFGHFDLLKYYNPWRLPVVTSRGCINACKYCFDHVFYGPYACLSGTRAFEQLRFLHDRHDRKVFEFSDLLCNGDLDELSIMCDLLIEAGMDLHWGSFAVMREGMTLDLMKRMHAAGCRYLHYGFETGSPRMLKLMGREYSVQDAADTLRHTVEAGIRARINVMVGFPGETDKTIQETIDFIVANAANITVVETVNPVYIMASTELADQSEKYGIEVPDGVPDHWEAGRVTEAQRRAWVNRVMEAIRSAGIDCKYSVMRGFTCKSVEKMVPV